MPSSPTALAVLKDAAGSLEPVVERVLAAALEFRGRGGRIVVPLTVAEVRAVVDASNSAPISSKNLRPGQVDFAAIAAKGGRVAPLLNVIPTTTNTVAQASETRGEVAAPTPYGTLLPESSITIVSSDVAHKRVGSYMKVTNGALEDAGQVAEVVRQVLGDDLLRALDVQALNGDGTGENLLGLTVDGSVPVQPRGADTHHLAILRAAAAVRGADVVGPIDVVLNAADLLDVVTSADYSKDDLDAFGIRGFVTSSRLAAGTGLVGSFKEAASLYVRQGGTITLSRDHDDWFLRGDTAVAIEGRFNLKLVRPTGLVKVTGL